MKEKEKRFQPGKRVETGASINAILGRKGEREYLVHNTISDNAKPERGSDVLKILVHKKKKEELKNDTDTWLLKIAWRKKTSEGFSAAHTSLCVFDKEDTQIIFTVNEKGNSAKKAAENIFSRSLDTTSGS